MAEDVQSEASGGHPGEACNVVLSPRGRRSETIELAGFVGALLALPVAEIIQIIVLDVLETNGHPTAPVAEPLPPGAPSSGA